MPEAVTELEAAKAVAPAEGAESVQILYNLGSTYAKLTPPRSAEAISMLKGFSSRACKGAKAASYKSECETTPDARLEARGDLAVAARRVHLRAARRSPFRCRCPEGFRVAHGACPAGPRAEEAMDLAERLNHLEAVHDWQGLAEELERGIASETDAATKAGYHLRLGRVLESKFLHAVRALKHFQDAVKLNPALTEALREARAIYWSLGKVNMVQKLLELELKSATQHPAATVLLVELGDVLSDAGENEKAAAAYARALNVSGGESAEARACLADVQVDEASFQSHVTAMMEEADAAEPAARGRVYLRAARIAKRFSPGDVEGLLAHAYESDPADRQVAALFEQILVEEDREQAILDAQRRVLDALSGPARAEAAFRYGVRWATRHQKPEIGEKLFEEALEHDPDNEGAFAYLRDLWGTKQGDWDRVVKLAEKTAGRQPSAFSLAQAGVVLWRNVGNLMRARSWFERLARVAPDHPNLLAFEAQIGEKLGAAGATPPTPGRGRRRRPHPGEQRGGHPGRVRRRGRSRGPRR